MGDAAMTTFIIVVYLVCAAFLAWACCKVGADYDEGRND